MIPSSELLISSDGSIYHLNLKPGEIADNIILVGDPGRTEIVAGFLTDIETTRANREFITVTGYYKGERVTVVSTGIGAGNIDIVLNELDALVNIDFNSREIKDKKKSLNFLRIGTAGALQADIPLGGYILSEKAIGIDGMLNFHFHRDAVCDLDFESEFINNIPELENVMHPYVVDSSDILSRKFSGEKTITGVTITAPGFYGSQGRVLRMQLAMPAFNNKIEKFSYKGYRITNYEMETSAFYGYSKLLGHKALTICLAIANRQRKDALKNYGQQMLDMIEYSLEHFI